jgi:hypothetical protein
MIYRKVSLKEFKEYMNEQGHSYKDERGYKILYDYLTEDRDENLLDEINYEVFAEFFGDTKETAEEKAAKYDCSLLYGSTDEYGIGW